MEHSDKTSVHTLELRMIQIILEQGNSTMHSLRVCRLLNNHKIKTKSKSISLYSCSIFGLCSPPSPAREKGGGGYHRGPDKSYISYHITRICKILDLILQRRPRQPSLPTVCRLFLTLQNTPSSWCVFLCHGSAEGPVKKLTESTQKRLVAPNKLLFVRQRLSRRQ